MVQEENDEAEESGMHIAGFRYGLMRGFQRPALIPLLSVILLIGGGAVLADECFVYVGTYTGQESEGIHVFRFDPATGDSGPIALAAVTDHPSFLAIDPTGRFLYAVNELETFRGEPSGTVSVFELDRGSGKLKPIQRVSSLGAGPAYVSLDRSGRFLMVANYNGGNCAVFPVGKDGRLKPRSAFVQDAGSSVNRERQAGPHTHAIQATRDNRFVLVADLGIDQVLLYRFDERDGTLTPGSPAFVKAEPGSGPRQVAEAPSGKFVYVLNELSSTVTVCAFEPASGALREKQTVSTLPEPFTGTNTAAEIEVEARGRFLYVSNRGDDSLVVFGIDPDSGELKVLERVPCGGRTPRHFALDPTGRWLMVANQDTNDIHLFRIDPVSGRLTATSGAWKVPRPVCVSFAPLRPATPGSRD